MLVIMEFIPFQIFYEVHFIKHEMLLATGAWTRGNPSLPNGWALQNFIYEYNYQVQESQYFRLSTMN